MRIASWSIALLVVVLAALALVRAQYAPEPAPEGPPPSEIETLATPPDDSDLIYEPGPSKEAAPAASDWTRAFSGGLWVYTTEYGWLWVPAAASPVAFENVPYAYLYTPTFGWTWYVSPWGFGSFYYGSWVRHVWHPAGWHHGWIAHPRVRKALPQHASRAAL